MSEGSCCNCGGFIGEPGKAYGYAGKWCYCATPATFRIGDTTRLSDEMFNAMRTAVQLPQQPLNQCGCVGPQNGEPLCPCAMRNVAIKDGRYVIPERDLGPAPGHKVF